MTPREDAINRLLAVSEIEGWNDRTNGISERLDKILIAEFPFNGRTRRSLRFIVISRLRERREKMLNAS